VTAASQERRPPRATDRWVPGNRYAEWGPAISHQGSTTTTMKLVWHALLSSLSTDRHLACCPSNCCHCNFFICWNGKYCMISIGSKGCGRLLTDQPASHWTVRSRAGTECSAQEWRSVSVHNKLDKPVWSPDVLFVVAILPMFYCHLRRGVVAMPIDSERSGRPLSRRAYA